jgi:hypothetical protein
MRKFDAIVQNCLGRAGEDRKLTERRAAALAQVS